MGIGTISKEAQKLLDVTERSLWLGLSNDRRQFAQRDRPGGPGRGRGGRFQRGPRYVGHAIGTAMHEQPQVPNYWPGSKGPL